MIDGMFTIDDEGTLIPLIESPYETEDILQALIGDYPSLIAGNQVNSTNPRRWILVTREMSVPDTVDGSGRWALDHFFLDQDAIPTLIEVKRSNDTRIRREVVGQMMDYAANMMAYIPMQTIRGDFELRCRKEGLESEREILNLIGEGGDVEAFWEKLDTNLQAGIMRLLFVADIIPPELKRIIEFMNDRMETVEVLGFEIRRYAGKNIKTIVPRVIGMTAKAEQKKSKQSSRTWDKTAILFGIGKVSQQLLPAANELFTWGEKHKDIEIRYGTGTETASAQFRLYDSGAFFLLYSNGDIEIPLSKFAAPYDDESARQIFVDALNGIVGMKAISPTQHYPKIHLRMLNAPSVGQFLVLYDKYIEAVMAKNK